MRRWADLKKSELDPRGIAIVTVSAEPPDHIAKRRGLHGLDATMLSDEELVVTDRYNLRNPFNITLRSGIVRAMPIPTTILVDAEGIVRWIDQSTDYQMRSHPDVVLGAIRAAGLDVRG